MSFNQGWEGGRTSRVKCAPTGGGGSTGGRMRRPSAPAISSTAMMGVEITASPPWPSPPVSLSSSASASPPHLTNEEDVVLEGGGRSSSSGRRTTSRYAATVHLGRKRPLRHAADDPPELDVTPNDEATTPDETSETPRTPHHQDSPTIQPISSRTKKAGKEPGQVTPEVGSGKVVEKTYSTVTVIEMVFPNGMAIMRRRSDGWINATHLLKVAGFLDKAKRTKVLEKDVHCCQHEKIQGGYGRYQGTWVPVDAARQIATKFGVYDLVEMILETWP
ncbi:hypothetical protein HDU67_003896 [Dinochytrium kinnereticum]|nr:hypothetical protein HDU67_003896 [Dinochytrium kinnereticum]